MGRTKSYGSTHSPRLRCDHERGAAATKGSRLRVEIDIDRQMLVLFDDGSVEKILPVSTGSNRIYDEKGIRGLAYTPRGRFRITGKIAGWRKSPLGLFTTSIYFSDGLAIHGNPSVPRSPQSHGCIRIPMSASEEMSKRLPVGMIVLIYDNQSFVSGLLGGSRQAKTGSHRPLNPCDLRFDDLLRECFLAEVLCQ